jgi:hypothetical protein
MNIRTRYLLYMSATRSILRAKEGIAAMFCPNCRFEYKAGITVCPDCNERLVKELPPAPDSEEVEAEYVDLITVYTSTTNAELVIAQSLLEGAGIEYFVKGAAVSGLFAGGQIGYNPVTGPIKLQVRSEDEDEAREVLSEMDRADDEEMDEQ